MSVSKWAALTFPSARSTAAHAVRQGADVGADLEPGLARLEAMLPSVLTRVLPSGPFRRNLKRELSAVVQQKRVPRVLLKRPPDYRRGILIGAAAVSSAVSVAGLIVLIWHQRYHHQTQQAS